jgi:hypothetical protein
MSAEAKKTDEAKKTGEATSVSEGAGSDVATSKGEEMKNNLRKRIKSIVEKHVEFINEGAGSNKEGVKINSAEIKAEEDALLDDIFKMSLDSDKKISELKIQMEKAVEAAKDSGKVQEGTVAPPTKPPELPIVTNAISALKRDGDIHKENGYTITKIKDGFEIKKDVVLGTAAGKA